MKIKEREKINKYLDLSRELKITEEHECDGDTDTSEIQPANSGVKNHLVEGDLKAPFSIATTPKCWRGLNSIPWIAPLYP